MTDKPLVPTEQKQVTFYESEITAVLIDGKVYASINHMCDALGLNRRGQRQRVERNDVLADGQRVCVIHTLYSGQQSTYVLRADLVPLWLAGVSTRRLDDDKKQKIIDFQKRAADVLWRAFQRGELTDDLNIEALAAAGDEAAIAHQMAAAVLKLAREHIQLRYQVHDHEQRLEALETAVSSPARVISESQAMELSQAVKGVALTLSKQTRRNEYGGVYGELYRKFGVTSYKALPLARFDEAMSWLNEWLQSLTDESPF